MDLLERLNALKGAKPLTLSAEGGGIPERLQVMNAAAFVIDYAMLEDIIAELGAVTAERDEARKVIDYLEHGFAPRRNGHEAETQEVTIARYTNGVAKTLRATVLERIAMPTAKRDTPIFSETDS